MKNSAFDEWHVLLAKLSDGTITAEETARFGELLKQDPISQEIYLDHMLVDGLLEREFSAVESGPGSLLTYAIPTPTFRHKEMANARRVRLSQWPVACCVGLLLLMAGVFWGVRPAAEPKDEAIPPLPVPLADSGFETNPQALPAPAQSASWYGDTAEVVGPQFNIVPLEGDRMLRFVRSKSEPDNGCELYQLVDVGKMADSLGKRSVAVEASAFFNAASADSKETDYSFGVTLYAYAGDPTEEPHAWPFRWEQPLKFGGNQIPADQDSKSWQRVTARLDVPAETQYVVVQISVMRKDHDPDAEFPGHFVDNVEVNLVSAR